MIRRMLVTGCVLAASLAPGWSGPAAAQDPVEIRAIPQVEPFEVRVERAAQLLEADPQAAIEQLDHLAVESVELRKTRPLEAGERPAHRQVFVIRARAHLQLLNNDKVEDSYLELLRIDPFFAEPLAPREQEILDLVRTRASGVLEVTSPVRDALVLLDGIQVGTIGDAPVRLSIVAGLYHLRLEKPGHQPAAARVTLVPGQTLAVADLAPRARVPPVAFLVDRPGVDVLVDGQGVGQTERVSELKRTLPAEEAAALDQVLTLARFDPSVSAAFFVRDPPVDRTLSVRFSGECFIEEIRTVAITADALARLDPTAPLLWFGESSAVRMLPDVGTLRVASVPTDADVYLDNQIVGRSPLQRDVCAGEHRVRVRHRIGSYNVTARIVRGRSEVIDVTLKPSLAFLGAVEMADSSVRPAPGLASTVDKALAAAMTTFRLATKVDLPPEIRRWTEGSTSDLVVAIERGDEEALSRLLKLATDNYDAPLVMVAVARGPAANVSTPLDLMLFWYEHAGADRVRVDRISSQALADVFARLNTPDDALRFVFERGLGLEFADTLLPDVPVVVARVEPGSPAALAGLKAGDPVTAVDGAQVSAVQIRHLLEQKKPGDVLTLRVPIAGQPNRQVAVPVQSRPRRAPIFEDRYYANALIAQLQAAAAVTPNAADRDVLNFNLALAHMRFGEWRLALGVFESLAKVPTGPGVGPGAALYFRALCHERLGERDRAVTLLREAATIDGELLMDDGSSVGALARIRLAWLGENRGAGPGR
ncbi:MAG: PEGA domain-containing protein [Acidobacteriota bacterium]